MENSRTKYNRTRCVVCNWTGPTGGLIDKPLDKPTETLKVLECPGCRGKKFVPELEEKWDFGIKTIEKK